MWLILVCLEVTMKNLHSNAKLPMSKRLQACSSLVPFSYLSQLCMNLKRNIFSENPKTPRHKPIDILPIQPKLEFIWNYNAVQIYHTTKHGIFPPAGWLGTFRGFSKLNSTRIVPIYLQYPIDLNRLPLLCVIFVRRFESKVKEFFLVSTHTHLGK